MSNEMMVQCELHKTGKETLVLFVWIPERFAIQDKILKLKREDGIYEDGWKVIKVFASKKMDISNLNERSQDYKRTRKASDI